MAWQPMPPPATWPSSSSVERLCGQPEQKVGKRAGTVRRSRAVDLVAACGHAGRALRAAAGSNRGQHARDRLRIEFAGRGKQRLAVRILLAEHRRAGRPSCRAPRAVAVRGSCASLRPPGWFRRPRGELGDEARLERKRHAELGDANAQRVQVVAARCPRSRSACIRS